MSTKLKNAPDGTRQGAWEVESELVRFALWAPNIKMVSVVGDFNGWEPTAHLLAVDEGDLWWCEIGLSAGEYEYMYVINEDQFIGDPYAREVN